MTRSSRAWALGLGLLLVEARTAHAADVPRTTPPPDTVEVEETHRFAPWKVGAVGAAAGITLLAGIATLTDSFSRFEVKLNGVDGNSCRPCSTGQMAGVRAEYGAGISLLVVAGGLAIVTGVMAGLDRRYRKEHSKERAVSRLQLAPTGFRF